VEDITLRHTVIRDFENKRIIIPNSVISNDVIVNSNFADDQICKWIDVRIGFDSSIADAKQILLEEIKNHPFYLDPRTPEQKATGVPEVVVRVLSWGEYAINIRVWAWTKDAPSGFVLSCDVLESVKNRFEKEGIEIPFPHRTVVHKSMPKF
jgi:small conductance mechanosensitive channel